MQEYRILSKSLAISATSDEWIRLDFTRIIARAADKLRKGIWEERMQLIYRHSAHVANIPVSAQKRSILYGGARELSNNKTQWIGVRRAIACERYLPVCAYISRPNVDSNRKGYGDIANHVQDVSNTEDHLQCTINCILVCHEIELTRKSTRVVFDKLESLRLRT